jgi:hypothetical protein
MRMRELILLKLALLLVCSALALFSVPFHRAEAAEISVDHPWVGKPPIVIIIGEIENLDSERFSSLVAGLPTAIVSLASPGGKALESMRIGEIIREKRFTTIVPDKMTCASSCGLIWLAGVRRYVWNTARIGFHGAFDPKSLQQSGPVNALVGAYLNKLGLSYEAVVYMTAASPTNMTWLHSDDAKRLGIAADALDSLSADAPISVESPSADSILRSEAEAFVINFFSQWSLLPEPKLVSVLAVEYADNVEYNGIIKTVSDIMIENKNVLRRWPIQSYRVRPETMTTNCAEKMFECMSTGVVDWVVKSPERLTSRNGSSRFSFHLGKISPERFVIMGQSIAVLANQ